jgi:hypothetical protein
VLTGRWLKVFTVLYQLIGIGILVEVLRRLGFAFVTTRTAERAAKAAALEQQRPKAEPGETAP